MIRGVQTAMSAMKAHLARQEVLARNLGNLGTPGYKQESAAVDGFSAALGRVERGLARTRLEQAISTDVIGSLGVHTAIDRVSVDFRQGRLEETRRPLDVALQGDGFLQVATPDGILFSRGGALYTDAERRLVTAEGYPVLDADGQEIVLGDGEVSISADGTILTGDVPAATLSVVEFLPGTRLAKVGLEYYVLDDPNGVPPTAATGTVVKQGYLEASNVDAVSAMSDLVSLVRAYQASQRMLQAQDELLGKAVNEVGRVV
ncbi:MAG: flagellar hook-basal body protein [Sphingomonadaceae bacterium]